MSVLKRPNGDDILAKYGPCFTVERIQQFNVGEKYEILCVDARWYHVEVEKFSADNLIATLHFPHWQRSFDYHGSLRHLYMAEIGTYSAVTSHNKYPDPNSGQKPERKPIIKDKSKPVLSYEAKTKYDDNFFSKPRPAWAKKRRAPLQDAGDDGNNSESSDGNYFNVSEENGLGLSVQRKEHRRSTSPTQMLEKLENVEEKEDFISNGGHLSHEKIYHRVTFNEEQPVKPTHVLFEIQTEAEEISETTGIASSNANTALPVVEVHASTQQPLSTGTATNRNKEIISNQALTVESLTTAASSSGGSGSNNQQEVGWAGEMLREFDFDTDKAMYQSLHVKLNTMMKHTNSILTKKSRTVMKKVDQLIKVRQLIDESLEILLQREKLSDN